MATPSFQLFRYMTNICFIYIMLPCSYSFNTSIPIYSLQHFVFACIFLQNGHDFYQMYNFSSVIVELIGADTRKNEKKGLFGGIIAGIVISLLLVVAAVVVIAV